MSQRSKYLSYLLRHKPESAGLTLDKEGWCPLPDLISRTDFTLDEIEEIVRTDEKERYSLRYWTMGDAGIPSTQEPTHIRANQGHSTDSVRLTFKKAAPPVVLYHGTSIDAVTKIIKEGLKPMNRHHVHLSADIEVARSVGGRRRSGFQVLRIDAKRMLADGHDFFLSDNGVWLVNAVPPKYLELTQ